MKCVPWLGKSRFNYVHKCKQFLLRSLNDVQKCKQFLPRNLENRKEAGGIDWLGKMAVEEEEENLRSKTVTMMGPHHGPTLSSEGGGVVRGGGGLSFYRDCSHRFSPEILSFISHLTTNSLTLTLTFLSFMTFLTPACKFDTNTAKGAGDKYEVCVWCAPLLFRFLSGCRSSWKSSKANECFPKVDFLKSICKYKPVQGLIFLIFGAIILWICFICWKRRNEVLFILRQECILVDFPCVSSNVRVICQVVKI